MDFLGFFWQKLFSICLIVFLCSTTGIIYVGEMSIEDTHACMKHSNALVNTSESEGMAAVVLEVAD